MLCVIAKVKWFGSGWQRGTVQMDRRWGQKYKKPNRSLGESYMRVESECTIKETM